MLPFAVGHDLFLMSVFGFLLVCTTIQFFTIVEPDVEDREEVIVHRIVRFLPGQSYSEFFSVLLPRFNDNVPFRRFQEMSRNEKQRCKLETAETDGEEAVTAR